MSVEDLVKKARKLCGCWDCRHLNVQCKFAQAIFARLCVEEDRKLPQDKDGQC